MSENFVSGRGFEFMSEVEKEEIGDEFIKQLGELIAEEESGGYILNVKRCREMIAAYNCLKEVPKSKGVKLSIAFNEPYPSMGYITLRGKNVDFFDSDGFIAAAATADNLDVYPMTDGNIKIEFTFHELTKKIKGV